MIKLVKVWCKNCDKVFYRPKNRFNEAQKMGWNQFCSVKCQFKFKTKAKILKCEMCGREFLRQLHSISKHNYCSHSCAAKAVNKEWSNKRNGAIFTCDNCKKVFKRWLIGNNTKYCSKKCQTEASLYTKEKLIKIIDTVSKRLKRTPAKREFWGGIDKACVRLFGSWNNAVLAAKLIPNRSHDNRMYKRIISKATDGHLCDSVSEVLIDNWLYENGIQHEKDFRYPNTNHKADWMIKSANKRIFIEYFGLANDSPRYDRCIQNKKLICKKHNISLISIYPKDLYPKIHLDGNLKNKFKNYLTI